MADIYLVIKILEKDYEMLKVFKEVPSDSITSRVYVAIAKGKPLPKGHGRLIDADDIDNHIVGGVDTRDCPTIIEADKAGSEDKE